MPETVPNVIHNTTVPGTRVCLIPDRGSAYLIGVLYQRLSTLVTVC